MTSAAAVTSTATHLIHPTVHAVTDSGNVIDLTVWSTHVAITTWAGATRLDDWTGNIPATTPQEWQAACKEATRIRNLFDTYGGPRGVETHANALRIRLAAEQARPTRMRDNARIGALYTELAALEDLSTKRARARLAQYAEAA